MPIAQTEYLFKLIKSLGKAEKRHFKLYVNRLDSNKNVMFIKLFDLIDKSKKMDEAAIESHFPKLKRNDFSNLKRNLYTQILKSLRMIHSRHDSDMQVREQLDYAKVLYGKGLHMHSLKLLDRIVPLATKGNQDILLLEVLEFEKMIESRHITRSRGVKNKLEDLITSSSRFQTTIGRTSALSNLSLRMQGMYIKMGFVKNQKEEFLIQSFFNSNLPKVISKNPGFYEEVLLHQSHVWYYYMLLDHDNALAHSLTWVDVFDQNEVMLEKDPDLYLRGIHYILTHNFYLREKDDFDGWLKRYQIFSERNQSWFNDTSRVLNFIYGYNSELNSILLHQRYERGVDLEKSLFQDLKKFSLKLDSHRVKMFHYKFAWIAIANGKFEKAIDHLNYIIQPKKGRLRDDLLNYAKLLHLICNYQLGNYSLVRNLTPSIKRQFELSGDLTGGITSVLSYLNKDPKNSSSTQAIEKLNVKIHKSFNHRYDKRMFNYFNFIDWSKSLKENCLMRELYSLR